MFTPKPVGYYKEYYRRNHEKVLTRCRAYYKKNRDMIASKHRTYYNNNRAAYLIRGKRYREKSMVKLRSQMFNIIPNRCYYESEYCSGPLEWDHKCGDGKIERRRLTANLVSRYYRMLKHPDRFMRLCRRHNHIKSNIDKDMFEAMILEMAERIKMKSYEQADYAPPEPCELSPVS